MDSGARRCSRSASERRVRGLVVLAVMALLVSACSQAGSSSPSKVGGGSKHHPPAKTTTLAARPSSGCSSSHPEVTLAKQTIMVDGMARWYLISTPPPSASQHPLPLVIDLHGLDEGAQLEALTTQFSPLGQADGFITVFPQGTKDPVQWDTDTGPGNYDIDFLSQMLDQIETAECVDETRIYATGLSDGAIMTSLLACEMSNRIAAFAPVSGVQLPPHCEATRPVPILAFHGTADPILLFNGGIGTAVLSHAIGKTGGPAPSIKVPPAKLNGPGYPATVAAWAKRDGCGAVPVNTLIEPHVLQRVYRCPPGVAVEFYIILGGGHAWPGSQFSEKIASITGPTTFEINATTTIWAFFKRFQI
jgi:polyhydroxybutyrate depolymerase